MHPTRRSGLASTRKKGRACIFAGRTLDGVSAHHFRLGIAFVRTLASFCLLCALALFRTTGSAASAQEPAALDTLRIAGGDTVAVDTGRVAARTADRSGLDTLVNYTAREIDFDVEKRLTVLTGDATIGYKDMTLEAERIIVDWDAQILSAMPGVDTLWADSAQTEIESLAPRGRPHFRQGVDDFTGDEIVYNMKTRIGRVRGGSTEFEEGFYHGEQFKRISDKVILVKGGDFTTCEAESSHYHFSASELKVNVGRRVIARPVVLYFADVPVLAAPYGIFPQQHGRTSGILIPTFGESSSQGRFLKDMGYYWAPSDYFDVRSTIDYYEKFGVLGRSGLRYEKRYTLTGNTSVDFNLSRVGGARHRDYSVISQHNQIIDRNTRLNISGAYYSSNSFVQNTGSVQQLLNQSVRSNATFSKSWDNSPWTFSANAGYTQNLKTDTWDATLPGMTLNHRSGLIFPPPKAPRNIRGAVAPKELQPPWYRAFMWNYAVSYRNDLAMRRQPKEDAIRPGLINLAGRQAANTTIYGTDSTVVQQRDGAVHTASLSANAKLLRYVSLVPRLGISSLWTRRAVRYVARDRIFDRDDQTGFFQRTMFDLGGSATTKLYGTANRPFGLGASFRHTMTPSVGFSYRPDFADKAWGYYDTAQLPDGRALLYDRFPATESVSGATPKGLSERFSFSLGHLFQMKTGIEDDPDHPVKRADLLTWNMGTGVDLKRDSLRWDNVGMNFRTALPGKVIGPVQGLSLDVTTVHSLYQSVGGRRVRRFYFDSPQGGLLSPLDLTSADIDVGFTVRAETLADFVSFMQRRQPPGVTDSTIMGGGDSSAVPYNPMQSLDFSHDNPVVPTVSDQPGREPSQLYQMPLTLQVNLHQRRNYEAREVTSSLNTSATFNLTPRWNVNFSYMLDLDRKEVRDTRVSITRDLHCWEAAFQWSPLGFRSGYFLRINLKSPQLKDVKIERHRGSGFAGQF